MINKEIDPSSSLAISLCNIAMDDELMKEAGETGAKRTSSNGKSFSDSLQPYAPLPSSDKCVH